jgi:shikimate dehydrogenase
VIPITARTRVVALIGDPVVHSRSPTMHNAAFAALGLDWVYVGLRVAPGKGDDAVRAARALGMAGLQATMPHKVDAARACDRLEADAAQLGAVNTIEFRAGTVIGDSTDGPGLVCALADENIALDGRHCLVLGAGGAGRAIALSLRRKGAAVTVAARREDRARTAAELAGGKGVPLSDAPVEDADIVINATPLGMHGEPPPFDPDRLRRGQFVFDTVFPADTPLLAAARARGVPSAGGLGMLVHQGALAFRRWTGKDAPLDVMRRAASGP